MIAPRMDANGLACDVREIPEIQGAALVVLRGALDAKNVQSFKSWMEELAQRGLRRLVFDLEGLKYVNSTGIACLINLSESVTANSGSVCLTQMQPKVKIILETLGVLAFFTVRVSPEAALSELRRATPSPVPPAPARPRPKVPAPRPASLSQAQAPRAGRSPGAKIPATSRPSPPVPAPPAPAPRRRNPVARLIRKVFGLR